MGSSVVWNVRTVSVTLESNRDCQLTLTERK